MSKLKNYISLVKFSHTIFAMPFALIGFVLGVFALLFYNPAVPVNDLPGQFREMIETSDFTNLWKFFLIKLAFIIGCMIFARSAAMAFNRWLDKNFDAKNTRTAIREIPSGVISANNALIFTIVSCALFLVTCFFINRICFYLSPVALFVVLFYSYTKRFTALCHLVLGVGLSLAPIGAYLAVTGQFALLPILFSFTVLFWVSGFDIIYALQDEEFDKSNQLHSIPAALGKSKALMVSNLMHVLSAACVIAAGIYGHFGYWYWIGVLVFCSLLIYQHTLVKPNDLRKVNMAFFTTNGIASVVFAIFVILDLFYYKKWLEFLQ